MKVVIQASVLVIITYWNYIYMFLGMYFFISEVLLLYLSFFVLLLFMYETMNLIAQEYKTMFVTN